jgi:hypothetical protein
MPSEKQLNSFSIRRLSKQISRRLSKIERIINSNTGTKNRNIVGFWSQFFIMLSAGIAAILGIVTLYSAIRKFNAETEKAILEAQKIRIEVAAKSSEDSLSLKATAYMGRGDGWYIVTANLKRVNSGIQTIVVHKVRFLFAYSSLDSVWNDNLGIDKTFATWINSPSSVTGINWELLNDPITYPLGGEFNGRHKSIFDSSGNLLDKSLRYQGNGVGVYMSGEFMMASHQIMVRFKSASAIGCYAEIEYSVDDRPRDKIMEEGVSKETITYIQAYVNSTLPVCGYENFKDCFYVPSK